MALNWDRDCLPIDVESVKHKYPGAIEAWITEDGSGDFLDESNFREHGGRLFANSGDSGETFGTSGEFEWNPKTREWVDALELFE